MINADIFYDAQAKLYIKTNTDNAFLTRTLLEGKKDLFEALLRNGVRRGINTCFLVVIQKELFQYYGLLLKLGANPNQLSLSSTKHSLLVDATQKQQRVLSQLLVDFGASREVYRHDKGTIEQGPCLEGLTLPTESLDEKYKLQMEVLIEEGQAEEALCVAAFINATAFARFLVENNIKANVPSKFLSFEKEQKLTAFEIFCINDNRTAMQFCIDEKTNPNELHGLYYPLTLAVIFKKHGAVKLLIDNGTSLGINESLIFAIKNIDIKMVELLLTQGADPDRKGILMAAAQSGNAKIVELLFNHGARAEAKEALLSSINANDASVAGMFFAYVKNTPLPPSLLIDSINDPEKQVMAILLLHNGADVNGTNPNGVTALMRIAKSGDIKALTWFLEFKPDLNIRGKNNPHLSPSGPIEIDNDILGMTAIEIASRRGHQSIVNLLLDKGAAPSRLVQKNNENSAVVQHTALIKYQNIQLSESSRIESRKTCVLL